MQIDRYLEIASHTPSHKKKPCPCDEDIEPATLYAKKDEQICRLHQDKVGKLEELYGYAGSMVVRVLLG